MKNLLVVAMLLLVSQYSSVYAQTELRASVYVGDERLENLLTEEQKDSVTHLTIMGKMAEEDYAFIRSNRLKRISELNFRDADIDTIPPHAFDFEWVSGSNYSKKIVVLPLSLKYIDDYGLCLYSYGTICQFVLTGKFPSLGENVFRSDKNKNEMGEILPSSDNEYLKKDSFFLTSINDSILYYCDEGYPVYDVPDGVHVIYSNVFENIGRIKEIILPKEVDSIGNRAFANIDWGAVCGSSPAYDENYIRLKSLTPPKLGTDVFLNLGFHNAIYVPEESFDIYKNTDGWKDLYLEPYKELPKGGIEYLQVNNSCLSVSNENEDFVLKSSKMICSIKCYNLNGQISHNMPVYDNEVHLNKNIINTISLVRVIYNDSTNETVKLKP